MPIDSILSNKVIDELKILVYMIKKPYKNK